MDWREFWQENEACLRARYSTDKPRAAATLGFDDHWLTDELQLPSTLRYYQDTDYRLAMNREGNDRLDEAIGIRPFSETDSGPGLLRIEEVFGSHFEVLEGGTPWLKPGVRTPQELTDVMDRIEGLSEAEFEALLCSKGAKPEVRPHNSTPWSRGPATVATSVIGTTETMFWLIDEPELMGRFFRLLGETMVRYWKAVGRLTGAVHRGFCWLDDNCALYSPDLYQEFCAPAMRRMFAEFAPEPDDTRFQHSDSAMEHLLPTLATYRLHGANLGPTLKAETIRRHLPGTIVHGQVAPFTLRNGGPSAVRAEILRDWEAIGADGGLIVTTAGSVPAGTKRDAIAHFLTVVHEECRYR